MYVLFFNKDFITAVDHFAGDFCSKFVSQHLLKLKSAKYSLPSPQIEKCFKEKLWETTLCRSAIDSADLPNFQSIWHIKKEDELLDKVWEKPWLMPEALMFTSAYSPF